MRHSAVAGDGMTLAEAARRTGVSRASARRLLHTHRDARLCPRRRWSICVRTTSPQLGYSYLQLHDLWEAAQLHMVELVEAIHESCSAAVLYGDRRSARQAAGMMKALG